MRSIVPILTRLLSTLLALALIAFGVVAIVEVVSARVGWGWRILPDDIVVRASTWQWSDRNVIATLAAVGIAGLLAVLTSLWRRSSLTVPVDGRPSVSIERFALERSLRSLLEAVDGVSVARVRVAGSRVVARVDTQRRHATSELKATAEEVLKHAVTERHLKLRTQLQLRHRGGEV